MWWRKFLTDAAGFDIRDAYLGCQLKIPDGARLCRSRTVVCGLASAEAEGSTGSGNGAPEITDPPTAWAEGAQLTVPISWRNDPPPLRNRQCVGFERRPIAAGIADVAVDHSSVVAQLHAT